MHPIYLVILLLVGNELIWSILLLYVNAFKLHDCPSNIFDIAQIPIKEASFKFLIWNTFFIKILGWNFVVMTLYGDWISNLEVINWASWSDIWVRSMLCYIL